MLRPGGPYRTQILGVALIMLVLSLAGRAAAQWSTIYWPALTEDDFNRMEAAAARLYEGRSIGSVESWRSPESKDAGEVKLTRAFDVNGMPCRTLDYTILLQARKTPPDHYVVNWCRVQGGEWKIVELPVGR